MDMGMIFKIVITTIALIVGIGSVYVGKYKGQHDNPIEEKAEEIIKDKTGFDVDLTPTSPEVKGNNGNK